MKRRASTPIKPLGWLLALVVATGLATPLAALAQDAQPTGSATREEIRAELEEYFQYEQPGNTEGTFVQGVVGDIQSANPLLAEEETSLVVTGLVYETLVGGDPRNGQPAPTALADRWEVAPDGVTYTFSLNQNARWHDGVDFTAADVAFSFAALADERTASAYRASFLTSVKEWRVVDPDTIQVVSNGVSASFLYDLFGAPIVPRHIWQDIPYENWASDPASTGQDPARVVGTGPFRFEEWVQGQEVRLVRNDDYYQKTPWIREYILRIFPDDSSVFNAFLNGEIDVAPVEPENFQIVEETDGLNVKAYDDRSFTYYEFNLNDAVETRFLDPKVRQAFMWALDRDSIVADILLGFGEVAQGVQPRVSYAYAPDRITTKYAYNPDTARRLLTEAGWTDTNDNGTVDKDGQEMEIELLYVAGSPTTDSLVAYLQEAWADVGITVNPVGLEFNAVIEAITTENGDWQMALVGFAWDATFITDAVFGCDQHLVGFNDMKYCNPQLDEINARARAELDQEKRRELLIQAANIVNDEQPIGVLYFRQERDGWNDRVRNYTPGPWGTDPLYIWVEE